MDKPTILNHYKYIFEANDENCATIHFLIDRYLDIIKFSYIEKESSELILTLNNGETKKYSIESNKHYFRSTEYGVKFYYIFIEILQYDILPLMNNLVELEICTNNVFTGDKFTNRCESLRKLTTNLFEIFDDEFLVDIEEIIIKIDTEYDERFDFWSDNYGVLEIMEKLPISITKIEIPFIIYSHHGDIEGNNRSFAEQWIRLPNLKMENIVLNGGNKFVMETLKVQYDLLMKKIKN